MKCFILLSILLPTLSFKVMIPKFCVNCKYIKEDNKCGLYPKKVKNINRLVDGIYDIYDVEYYYCSVIREMECMCGPEGKMYVKRDEKV